MEDAAVHVMGNVPLRRHVPIYARAATGPKHLIISKVLGPLSAMSKKPRTVLFPKSMSENPNSGSGGPKAPKSKGKMQFSRSKILY